MRVLSQKNTFYVDLSKNVSQGYIETRISRTPTEEQLVFCASQLDIQAVFIIETNQQIEPKVCDSYFEVALPKDAQLSVLTVRVTFTPGTANSSYCWYRPVGAEDKHRELLTFSMANAACVAPFIDAACQLELVYVVPNSEDVSVVSPGQIHAVMEREGSIVYAYRLFSHPKHLLFSVGTHSRTEIFNDCDTRSILLPSTHTPGQLDDPLSDLQQLFVFIDSFAKSDSLSTFTLLFTLLDCSMLVSPNVLVLPLSSLPGPRDVEPAYEFKRRLADGLGRILFDFISWDKRDSWIQVGFAGYVADCCIKQLLGTNEFLYDWRSHREYVLANDVVEEPLFYTRREEYDTRFFKAKSRLVFHALEAQLSPAFLHKIAEEVLRERSYQRLYEEMRSAELGTDGDAQLDLHQQLNPHPLFTPQFAHLVKSITGRDIASFLEFHVFFPGSIVVRLALHINRKHNSVSISVTQHPTSLLPGCNTRVSAPITLKSVETEGTFEHSIAGEGESTFFYHARTKKKRKDEEEENIMPLLFIRPDPKRETFFKYLLDQPDFMYIEQLAEKSVLGQLEAIEALRDKPSLMSCEALERLMEGTHTFYKVRIEAMRVLGGVRIEGYNGMQRLMQYFVRTRCVAGSTVLRANEFGLVPYFIQKHLVRCIGLGTEQTRNGVNDEGYNPNCEHRTAVAFLQHALRFNDNSQSQFDDAWYVAVLIETLGRRLLRGLLTNSRTHDPSALQASLNNLQSYVRDLERLRLLDMVFPSSNNIITQACISSLITLSQSGLLTLGLPTLRNLACYPNLCAVRLVALEALLRAGDTSYAFAAVDGDTPYLVASLLALANRLISAGVSLQLDDSISQRLTAAGSPFSMADPRLARKLCVARMSREKFLATRIEQFSLLGEEQFRKQIRHLGPVHHIRVVGLRDIRLALLRSTGTLRIPRLSFSPSCPLSILRLPLVPFAHLPPSPFLILPLSFPRPLSSFSFLSSLPPPFFFSSYFSLSPIPSLIPFSPLLRSLSSSFLSSLSSRPSLSCFYHPVDCTLLPSYLSTVRIPVCFSDILTLFPSFLYYDAFISRLLRICTNCLLFNRANSPIAQTAKQLQREIKQFNEQIRGEHKIKQIDGKEVLAELMRQVGEEGMANRAERGEYTRWIDVKRAVSESNRGELKRLIEMAFPIDNWQMLYEPE